MKTLLALLVAVSCCSAQFDCIKKYAPALEEIQQEYIKQQQGLNKTSTTQRYQFEFVNIELFPFFCLPKNIRNPKSTHEYLCDYTGSFLRYTDALGDEHLQIGVVSYIQEREIYSRTYRLFFYIKRPTINWSEEKDPIKIIFIRKGDAFIPKD